MPWTLPAASAPACSAPAASVDAAGLESPHGYGAYPSILLLALVEAVCSTEDAQSGHCMNIWLTVFKVAMLVEMERHVNVNAEWVIDFQPMILWMVFR